MRQTIFRFNKKTKILCFFVDFLTFFASIFQEGETNDRSHCSLALFSGGGLLGGAGAADFVAGSLSSCLTASVGGSGSFFTSTATQRHEIRGNVVDYADIVRYIYAHHQNLKIYLEI